MFGTQILSRKSQLPGRVIVRIKKGMAKGEQPSDPRNLVSIFRHIDGYMGNGRRQGRDTVTDGLGICDGTLRPDGSMVVVTAAEASGSRPEQH